VLVDVDAPARRAGLHSNHLKQIKRLVAGLLEPIARSIGNQDAIARAVLADQYVTTPQKPTRPANAL